MKHFPTMVVALAALALSLASPQPAYADDEFIGEILDMACYVGRGARGPSHTRCAQKCAEHNMPLGLLTDDGTVYLLYPKHGGEEEFEAVKKLAGAKAKLTGKPAEQGGLKGLEVHSAVPAE